MSTALIYSDEYLKHDTGNHPERRERYQATLHGLMADEDFWNDLLKIAPRDATRRSDAPWGSVSTRPSPSPRALRRQHNLTRLKMYRLSTWNFITALAL